MSILQAQFKAPLYMWIQCAHAWPSGSLISNSPAVHVRPSLLSVNPEWQEHVNEPCVLEHSCWQLWVPAVHSLMSICDADIQWKKRHSIRILCLLVYYKDLLTRWDYPGCVPLNKLAYHCNSFCSLPVCIQFYSCTGMNQLSWCMCVHSLHCCCYIHWYLHKGWGNGEKWWRWFLLVPFILPSNSTSHPSHPPHPSHLLLFPSLSPSANPTY